MGAISRSAVLLLLSPLVAPISAAFVAMVTPSTNNNERYLTLMNSVVKAEVQHQQQHENVPSLIVFDLDNTLWTPELYQLRTFQQSQTIPLAGRDVKLFPGAQIVLDSIRSGRYEDTTRFAIASRTKSVEWAHNLLQQFGLVELMDFVEIFPGSKTTHFENLHAQSGIPYSNMLFFDDARDGKFGNCVPVSSMGVLTVHCPDGLTSEGIFTNSLLQFSTWDKRPSIIESDGTLTLLDLQTKERGDRLEGVVKMVNEDRRFGFIQTRAGPDVFFHFNNLPKRKVKKGDSVSFVVSKDPKNADKRMAVNIELIPPFKSSLQESTNKTGTVTMNTFSMNLPFAALLANQYKTLETRNGTMFVPYPPGTKMLLHVGKRIYPDGDRHVEVMRSGGRLSMSEILQLKALPPGYGPGMAIAIVELGRTYETTVEERSTPEVQQNVGAFGTDSGKMVTEIRRVEYLTRAVPVSGKGGVFKVDIDTSVIPPGWI